MRSIVSALLGPPGIILLGALITAGGIFWQAKKNEATGTTHTGLLRQIFTRVGENAGENTGLLVPGMAETPKIERGPIAPELLQTVPEFLREELQSSTGKSVFPIREIPESAVIIFLGNSVSWTRSFPHTVLQHKDENIIVLGKDGENLWVTAKFFGENGKIICQLVKNRFHLNWRNLWRIERPSRSKLVLINDKAQEILNVEYINKRAVRILGDFYSLGGAHIVIRPDWQSLGGAKMSACISGDNGGASYAIQ